MVVSVRLVVVFFIAIKLAGLVSTGPFLLYGHMIPGCWLMLAPPQDIKELKGPDSTMYGSVRLTE